MIDLRKIGLSLTPSSDCVFSPDRLLCLELIVSFSFMIDVSDESSKDSLNDFPTVDSKPVTSVSSSFESALPCLSSLLMELTDLYFNEGGVIILSSVNDVSVDWLAFSEVESFLKENGVVILLFVDSFKYCASTDTSLDET